MSYRRGYPRKKYYKKRKRRFSKPKKKYNRFAALVGRRL